MGRRDFCSKEVLIYLGETALQWDNNSGERRYVVTINFTIFRVLLGAGQVQHKGKRKGGREEGKKEAKEGGKWGREEERVAVKLDLTSCL